MQLRITIIQHVSDDKKLIVVDRLTLYHIETAELLLELRDGNKLEVLDFVT